MSEHVRTCPCMFVRESIPIVVHDRTCTCMCVHVSESIPRVVHVRACPCMSCVSVLKTHTVVAMKAHTEGFCRHFTWCFYLQNSPSQKHLKFGRVLVVAVEDLALKRLFLLPGVNIYARNESFFFKLKPSTRQFRICVQLSSHCERELTM